MFLDLYRSNPPQQRLEGPRALLLSAALLREERERGLIILKCQFKIDLLGHSSWQVQNNRTFSCMGG